MSDLRVAARISLLRKRIFFRVLSVGLMQGALTFGIPNASSHLINIDVRERRSYVSRKIIDMSAIDLRVAE